MQNFHSVLKHSKILVKYKWRFDNNETTKVKTTVSIFLLYVHVCVLLILGCIHLHANAIDKERTMPCKKSCVCE